MKKKKKHYKIEITTRKDFSFLLFHILLIVFFIAYFIILIFFNEYFSAIISLLLAFIFISNLLNNKIILEKYYLRINFGIFTYKIKYKDIKSLYTIDKHILGLSSSYHKIGIKTNRYKSILFDTFVSPFDREEFIEEVLSRQKNR